jgi:hypothetical protein
MSGYRQAVVALHDLGEPDRDWILARLPKAERATLECYLDELKSLGFAAGTSLATAQSAPHGGAPIDLTRAARDGDVPSASVCLRGAPAHRIAAILQGEPPSLVAQFMAIEDWPWEVSVLGQLNPVLRYRVNQARSAVTRIVPRRRGFLLQAVARRLGEFDAGSPGASRPVARAAQRLARGLRATIKRLGVPWER